MDYNQFKNKQQEDFNTFSNDHIFYAFSNEQFEEGMKKLGITKDDKLIHISGGGYMRKSDEPLLDEVFLKMKIEMKEFKKKQKYLISAIVYELGNHEYCITYDLTDALESLGIFEDYKTGNQQIVKAVKEAKKLYALSLNNA